jgi:hypothetical protein
MCQNVMTGLTYRRRGKPNRCQAGHPCFCANSTAGHAELVRQVSQPDKVVSKFNQLAQCRGGIVSL